MIGNLIMQDKSLLDEIKETNIAMELISLGARMQVLENETSLSRRKLLRLYKELKGCSPPKGLLPFSPDWFMAWEQNVHSSMFYNIYLYLKKTLSGQTIEHIVKAYKLYNEQCYGNQSEKPVLGLTRAWTLVRFIDCGMIKHTKCFSCGGTFVVTHEHGDKPFICSLCCTPSRAVKKTMSRSAVTTRPATPMWNN